MSQSEGSERISAVLMVQSAAARLGLVPGQDWLAGLLLRLLRDAKVLGRPGGRLWEVGLLEIVGLSIGTLGEGLVSQLQLKGVQLVHQVGLVHVVRNGVGFGVEKRRKIRSVSVSLRFGEEGTKGICASLQGGVSHLYQETR